MKIIIIFAYSFIVAIFIYISDRVIARIKRSENRVDYALRRACARFIIAIIPAAVLSYLINSSGGGLFLFALLISFFSLFVLEFAILRHLKPLMIFSSVLFGALLLLEVGARLVIGIRNHYPDL